VTTNTLQQPACGNCICMLHCSPSLLSLLPYLQATWNHAGEPLEWSACPPPPHAFFASASWMWLHAMPVFTPTLSEHSTAIYPPHPLMQEVQTLLTTPG
jgi:hypothetical protein